MCFIKEKILSEDFLFIKINLLDQTLIVIHKKQPPKNKKTDLCLLTKHLSPTFIKKNLKVMSSNEITARLPKSNLAVISIISTVPVVLMQNIQYN